MTIKKTTIRTTVQAQINGVAYEGAMGTPLEDFVQAANLKGNGRAVAALVNGKLRELSQPLNSDAKVESVTRATSDGMRIYRRSLSFLMIAAAAELFPGHDFVIQHSMPFGGYYCEKGKSQPLTNAELAMLCTRMKVLAAENLPINQIKMPLEQALQLFRDQGDAEKADLFAKRRKDYLTLYELNGIKDYFHGFMVPSTGYLDLFELRQYGDGFILQFPRRQQPDRLQPFEDEPRLASVFQDYSDWLEIMGVPTIAALNDSIRKKRTRELIIVAEAIHQRQLAHIATEINKRRAEIKLILISGPTSAGKTTFSRRLAVQLLAQGIFPITLGMDNYFVNRDLTPLDENGEYDFETIEAVDTRLFQQHVNALLAGEQIIQPSFDFHTGTRGEGEPLQIGPEHVIIIEGIHGLNPRLVEGIAPEAIYRIFISAFTQLNLDKHNRVPTTDTRMLRRIVRDAAHRGYTAADTIARWQSIRRGEKRHIFPYQNNADIFFNSALVYELAVLKRLAQPLLLQVEPGTPERIEANRLIAFLQWFDPIPPAALSCIPGESILREFVGGSTLEEFNLWQA